MRSILNHSQKKKLKKLIRDPKRYFMDSPLFKYFLRNFNIFPVGKGEEVIQFSLVPVQGHSKFESSKSWREFSPEKTIVLIFGFQDWKKNFIGSFIPECEIVFAKAGCSIKDISHFLKDYEIDAFVTWGVNQDPVVVEASEKFMKPIWSMEDGFIRSVDLGSNHTTPRSLVLDKSGIYFDSRRPSDLENLLNEWDLEKNQTLVKQAASLFDKFKSLNLSKYNPPSAALMKLSDPIFLGGGKAILVIGQLDGDASLRYGGCENITNKKIIELAIEENPGRVIIYRPHPDQLKYNKKHLQEIRVFGSAIEIADEDELLAHLFMRVDRVYTMTSLAGLEAALRGLSVTVLGAPFYAGWGLTDDRLVHPRRKRRLSPCEFFTIAYVVYPRYIAKNSNPIINCLSAMQLVVAERELAIKKVASTWLEQGSLEIFDTIFWKSVLLDGRYSERDRKLKSALVGAIPYSKIFHSKKTLKHKRVLAYLIAGALESSPQLDVVVKHLSFYVDEEILGDLLTDLWRIRPTNSRLLNWAELCEKNGKYEDARASLKYLSEGKGLPEGEGLLTGGEAENKFKFASFEFRRKKYSTASRALEENFVSGHLNSNYIHLLGQILIAQYEYEAAYEVYEIIKIVDPGWLNGHAHLMCARLSAILGKYEVSFAHAAMGSYINPHQIAVLPEDTGFWLDDAFGNLPFAEAMSEAVHATERGTVLDRASADISVGEFLRAEKALIEFKPKRAERDRYVALLSQSLSYQGKTVDATRLVQAALNKNSTHILFREAFRLATQDNNVDWIQVLLSYSKLNSVPVTEVYKRKAATILGDSELYYKCLREMASSNHLKAHFGERYIQSFIGHKFLPADRILIIAYFGPGDEIRWASIYPEMVRLALPGKATFTCDPRLLTLFERSYPELSFVPSKRTRNLKCYADLEGIKELPSSDLFRHLDNSGWRVASQMNYVTLQVDLLADLAGDHDSLCGEPFLIPDPGLVNFWKSRIFELSKYKPKVGISWRSSVLSTTRNQYYLDILQVESIISEFPDFDFYCLQYDDCTAERDYIQSVLPGRLHYFDEFDYFNDFENFSAVISSMDVVISPGTSVVELSGALGVESILFCPTAELDWRYRKNSSRDVWFKSVQHVKPDVLNDKEELLKNIKSTLRNVVKNIPIKKDN